MLAMERDLARRIPLACSGRHSSIMSRDTASGAEMRINFNRWYDPSIGRWLSEDPAAADENLYRYCGNGPTDGTDPSGRWTIGCNIIGFMTMPIHERLTVLAALDAGYKAKGYEPGAAIDGNTPSIWCLDDFKIQLSDDPFFLGLVDGCRAVDAPNGLVELGYCCSDVEKGNSQQAEAKYRATFRSHFGLDTYKHGMVPHAQQSAPGEAPAVGAAAIQRKMVDWICSEYQAALLDAKQIKDMEKSGADSKALAKLQTDAGFHIGQALHTLEDSYAPAHVWRGGPTASDPTARSANGLIYMFQDYNAQDPSKHGEDDDPGTNAFDQQCYNAVLAACTQFMKMSLAGTPVEGNGGVRDWLLHGSNGSPGPLELAPNARAGGTYPAYAKTNN